MKPNQRTNNRPQGKTGADRHDPTTPPDTSVQPRNRSGKRANIQHSLSGEPDRRRDDEINPSPEGPAAGPRGDSDIEGVHDRRDGDVERE